MPGWAGRGAPWIVDDGLWELIAPLLPWWLARSLGPRPIDDRRCLQPILFVLPAGIGGQDLPPELGLGCGMTCGRRWRRWTGAGIFGKLSRILLAVLHAAGAIDWSQAVADAACLPAKKGGVGVGPWPVDRARPGSKHHLICDGAGILLKVITTGGNVTDVSLALDLVDGIAPVAGRPGRPRRYPDALLADNGYHSHRLHRERARRRIVPIVSSRGTKGVQGLGKLRYVVE